MQGNEMEINIMWIADNWADYRLIDSSGGEKLEYWGNVLLRRPEPQAVWSEKSEKKLWEKTDAWYHRSSSGGGAGTPAYRRASSMSMVMGFFSLQRRFFYNHTFFVGKCTGAMGKNPDNL